MEFTGFTEFAILIIMQSQIMRLRNQNYAITDAEFSIN